MKSLDSVDFDEYESILDMPKPTQNRQRKSRCDVTRTPNPKMNNTMNVSNGNQFQAISPPSSTQTVKSITQPLSNPLPLLNNTTQFQYSPSLSYSKPPLQMIQNSIQPTSQMTSTPIKIILPVEQLNPYQGAIMQNGIIQLPHYHQVIVNIPTIDILQKQQQLLTYNCIGGVNETQLNVTNTTVTTDLNNTTTIVESTPKKSATVPVLKEINEPSPSPVNLQSTDCEEITPIKIAESTPVREPKIKINCYLATKYQQRLYKNLSHNLSASENIAHDTINGFTSNQRKLFDQQMRIHLQFATEKFIQTFKHPLLGNYSQEFKQFLVSFVLQNNLHYDWNSNFPFLRLKLMKLLPICHNLLSTNDFTIYEMLSNWQIIGKWNYLLIMQKIVNILIL